jgi:hypothetical protein
VPESAVLAGIQPPRQRPRLRLPEERRCAALTDTRDTRGARARAVRDAADIGEARLAGLRPVHLEQIELFPTGQAQS